MWKTRNYYLESPRAAIRADSEILPLKWPDCADTVCRAFGTSLKNPEKIQ